MTADPIKAALVRAAKVICYGGRDSDRCGHCIAASQCISHHAYLKATAASVAEFLRSPDVWNAVMEDYEAVTEAVEHAAREGGR